MKKSDLPTAELVGGASDVKSLVRLLRQASSFPLVPFTHFDVITGAEESGRILIQSQPFPSFASPTPLYRPMGLGEVADSFFKEPFLREVRYDPAKPNSPGLKKGWRVCVVREGGISFPVLWAAWM